MTFAHCLADVAAHELVEIDTAETLFETAVSVDETIDGRHSVPARLADGRMRRVPRRHPLLQTGSIAASRGSSSTRGHD